MVVTAAQAELRPLGLQRHKRTRIWVEDRGWWLLFAEFERAGAETHVGVGVTWLWSGTASVSYDLGGRLYWREETGDFATEHPRDGHTWVRSIHYADDGQFSTGLKQITGIVRRRVEQLRQEITTPAYVARLLSAPQSRVGATSWWHTFHTGAAAGLSGDTELARRQFARIRPDRMAEGWERDLGRRAAALLALADDPPELYRRLSADISETRSRLGLPETPPGTPPEPQW
ncbi:hypothetical protein SAMN04489716_4897 [Actinoplanes derwentensis]|uniref:DUF4304 domain-containing protein n=2 Tax=Actinoplanes derwentensis TaxID=113562 RepID=A0A1H2BV00_9ACTN|nr:hypothetical protein Ade03nite_20150 [Actinoplanes derwentensis]SDT61749.1 hypothetical protein SAMN04489716_4897 [Actinoplanes derwentensis]